MLKVVGNTAKRTLGSYMATSSRHQVAQFHQAVNLMAASVFKMPAMSPTMTEGGITSWKFQPGDEFLAGDVLVEVETDKATIDVEAQDDGIMFEILVKEGESGIAVGKPIAFLAEPGDDISSLEKPSVEEEAPSEPEPSSSSAEEPATSEPTNSDSKPMAVSSSGTFTKADPNQFLFPSVEILLHENHISKEEALDKIEASGPKGRLLKGDVLAFLGKIKKESVAKVADYINHKQHLDLSNIVSAGVASSKPKTAEAGKEDKATAEKPVQPPAKPQNILTVQLSSDLDDTVNKEKFQYAFEKSIHSAIKRTYAKRFPQYANSPMESSTITRNPDDLFDDLLAPAVNVSRFSVYGISYDFKSGKPQAGSSYQSYDDFDDLLMGPTASTKTPSPSGATTVDISFNVKYEDKLIDAKLFVEEFQDSLLTQVPSKKLVVFN